MEVSSEHQISTSENKHETIIRDKLSAHVPSSTSKTRPKNNEEQIEGNG